MGIHGSFQEANPKTEWLVDDSGKDRDMSLLEEFWYEDPDGRKWTAPKGSVVNGASIPRPLWSTVGSPYTDDYRRASIVHDVACMDPTIDRKEADVMFYYACLAGGCGYAQAKMLYAGVRLGAWASAKFAADCFASERVLFRVGAEANRDEQSVQTKFQEIAPELLELPDEASIAELDAVIEKHVEF